MAARSDPFYLPVGDTFPRGSWFIYRTSSCCDHRVVIV